MSNVQRPKSAGGRIVHVGAMPGRRLRKAPTRQVRSALLCGGPGGRRVRLCSFMFAYVRLTGKNVLGGGLGKWQREGRAQREPSLSSNISDFRRISAVSIRRRYQKLRKLRKLR